MVKHQKTMENDIVIQTPEKLIRLHKFIRMSRIPMLPSSPISRKKKPKYLKYWRSSRGNRNWSENSSFSNSKIQICFLRPNE
jgi:hypothetical protein